MHFFVKTDFYTSAFPKTFEFEISSENVSIKCFFLPIVKFFLSLWKTGEKL